MDIGLNVTEAVLLKSADRQAMFAGIKTMGINLVRIEIPWLSVVSNWATSDPLIADAANAGLEILAMVAHNPTPKPSAAAFGTAMGKLAAKYPQISHWEIWNEQNLQEYWAKGSPETFVPYLQAAAKAIRANSTAKIVLGGLAAASSHSGIAIIPKFPFIATYTNVDPVTWMTRAYRAGAKGSFDIVALHPYCMDAGFRWLAFSPGDPYVASISMVRNVMNDQGDTGLDIWATEYGFPISAFTPDQQTANLSAQTAYLEPRVARAIIMCYRDIPKGSYGLIDKNNAQRPAYTWLKSLLAS